MFKRIISRIAITFLLLELFLPFHHLSVHAAGTLKIVDNNVNKNVITDLHGYCAGADFRYDVYWNDDTVSISDVELLMNGTAQQTIGITGFNAGANTSSSPSTYIRRNNSNITPFTIQVREIANTANISDSVTVTPKDCTSNEVGSDQNFTSSNSSAYTVLGTGVTHVRVSVIGWGGMVLKNLTIIKSQQVGEVEPQQSELQK